MKNYIIILISFSIIATGASIGSSSERVLHYREVKDAQSPDVIIGETKIILDEETDHTHVHREKQGDQCMVEDEFDLDREQSLIKWRRVCKEEQTDYTAVREGDMLNITGTYAGEPIDKQIELGPKALHIYPKYSLSKFALSGVPRLELWTLRRDELTKLPMKAERKGVETITINGKDVQAIKIYYAIKGKLREKHFNHTYYYRKSDGLFLKKEENTGRVETLIKEE